MEMYLSEIKIFYLLSYLGIFSITEKVRMASILDQYEQASSGAVPRTRKAPEPVSSCN